MSFEDFIKNLKFNNVEIPTNIFTVHTPYFYLRMKASEDIFKWEKVTFPFNVYIPDYLIDLFQETTESRRKDVFSFLKLFLLNLLRLNYTFLVNKYLLRFYVKNTFFSKEYFLTNKRNIAVFFSRYFTEPIQVIENAQVYKANKKQFCLWKSLLYSDINKSAIFGKKVSLYFNHVNILLKVHANEFDTLRIFLKKIGLNLLILNIKRKSIWTVFCYKLGKFDYAYTLNKYENRKY